MANLVPWSVLILGNSVGARARLVQQGALRRPGGERSRARARPIRGAAGWRGGSSCCPALSPPLQSSSRLQVGILSYSLTISPEL